MEGCTDGLNECTSVGTDVGEDVGIVVGTNVGSDVGESEGLDEGVCDGFTDGETDGSDDGEGVIFHNSNGLSLGGTEFPPPKRSSSYASGNIRSLSRRSTFDPSLIFVIPAAFADMLISVKMPITYTILNRNLG